MARISAPGSIHCPHLLGAQCGRVPRSSPRVWPARPWNRPYTNHLTPLYAQVDESTSSADHSDEAGTTGGAYGEPQPPLFQSQFMQGNAYLLLVSLLWGSYTPALRTIFTIPGGPTPFVVAAARGILQATLLGSAVALTASATRSKQTAPQLDEAWTGGFMSPLVRGSLEIGAYNTAGTLLQTWGLSLTSATRGAFLVQATALFTPLLAAAFGMAPSALLWLSSLVALVATLLVTLDQAEGSSAAASLLGLPNLGDAVTLGAALCYSLATVRIPMYAQRVAPLHLALGKSAVLAAVSTTALAAQAASLTQAGTLPAAELWPGGLNQPVAWAIIAWSAVGPGAVSAYLHVKGQSMVGPTDAQVMFAMVPLWSALMAVTFVPGESVGLLTWVGGGGMLAAGMVAAVGQQGGRPEGAVAVKERCPGSDAGVKHVGSDEDDGV